MTTFNPDEKITISDSLRKIFEESTCPVEIYVKPPCDEHKVESDDDWERACRVLYGPPTLERCSRCSGGCGFNRSFRVSEVHEDDSGTVTCVLVVAEQEG